MPGWHRDASRLSLRHMGRGILTSLAMVLAALPACGARVDLELRDGWRFVRGDLGPQVAATAGEPVTVPHTWNAHDGQNGKAAEPALPDGYYRGGCWYVRDLAWDPQWAGRRVYLRFEAAALVTDVWVNEAHVGQHRGGFAAFVFELTPYLAAGHANQLRIRVDNAHFEDVPPLQGDFTVFGGLYRPVHLIVTDTINIAPDHFGSPGVFLTPKALSDDEATVQVRTLLSSSLGAGSPVDVSTIISDAGGAVVARDRVSVTVGPHAVAEPVEDLLTVPAPHRWNGRGDPYLYSVEVSVHREGRMIDRVRQPLGLRTIAITEEQGVLLNGKPYPIHGVSRHQDRLDKGWALSRSDHEEDFAMMQELGCTSVRLAHYQQSGIVHELGDRSGLLLWQEIPLIDRISGLPEFAANARQQLTEMILQGYNHPSLCFWGLYNELNATWARQPSPPPEDLLRELRALARELDGSRPVVAASWMRVASPLHDIPDHMAFNVYPGWYWGTPEEFAPLVQELSGHLGGRRIAISEYGAGASAFQHEEGPLDPPSSTASKFHPEEWQTALHERIWAQMRGHPQLWGTWVWCMFDFASDQRDEGDTAGRNDKGLVTYDRKTRKDAFYFYKANWTDEPMVHIAGARFERRRNRVQEVHVYSTCPAVELLVNGVSQGTCAPDATHVARWPEVALAEGANQIEAVASRDGREYRETCAWTLAPMP